MSLNSEEICSKNTGSKRKVLDWCILLPLIFIGKQKNPINLRVSNGCWPGKIHYIPGCQVNQHLSIFGTFAKEKYPLFWHSRSFDIASNVSLSRRNHGWAWCHIFINIAPTRELSTLAGACYIPSKVPIWIGIVGVFSLCVQCKANSFSLCFSKISLHKKDVPIYGKHHSQPKQSLQNYLHHCPSCIWSKGHCLHSLHLNLSYSLRLHLRCEILASLPCWSWSLIEYAKMGESNVTIWNTMRSRHSLLNCNDAKCYKLVMQSLTKYHV